MSAASSTTPAAHAERRRSRRSRVVGWTVAGVLALVVIAAAWFAYDVREARSALARVTEQMPTAQQAVADGDTTKALAITQDMVPDTKAARAHTSGPLWALAARLPGVGEDVKAVRVASAAADDLARKVTPALASVARTMSGEGLSISNGTVNVTALSSAAPRLALADSTAQDIDRRLADVDVSRLHTEIAGPFEKLVAGTAEVRSLTGTAHRAAVLAPAMLGDDGARRYLVVAMNSAELRSGGGIPGAFAEVSVDHGKVALARQAATSDIGPFAEAVAPLGGGDAELYADLPAHHVQDTTMIPDYPTAARLTATMWKSATGRSVDGVIATDPVALSYLLAATGPVTANGVRLTSDNVVEELLSSSYSRLPADQTDAYFSAVAAQVLTRLLAGGTDPHNLLDALDRAASEHRILVWSDKTSEEKELANTVLSGAIYTAAAAADSVGVFFNDATGAKMDYYLTSDVIVSGSRCIPGGRTDTVEVPLGSTAPARAAHVLPWYVTGGGLSGVPAGLTGTQVVLYPPRSGSIADVALDGKPVAARTVTVSGRSALAFPVTLSPGQRVTLSFSATTPAALLDAATNGASSVDVWSTPTTSSPGLHTFSVAACD